MWSRPLRRRRDLDGQLSEVCRLLVAHGFDISGLRGEFAELGLELVPFDADDAEAAAGLWPATRAAGLSLADRACISLARRLKPVGAHGRPVVARPGSRRRNTGDPLSVETPAGAFVEHLLTALDPSRSPPVAASVTRFGKSASPARRSAAMVLFERLQATPGETYGPRVSQAQTPPS